MVTTPFKQIQKELTEKIPSDVINFIPDKWEKIGDTAIIKLKDDIEPYKKIIGRVFSEVLNCKSVLRDVSGISGEYRLPNVENIYGSGNCETIHIENGVRFKLDPSKVMFSSGNMDERRRMAYISKNDETVVDLFAGIGYFCLPMAVYSRPKRIFACEINPVAYEFLCKNIVLNNVSSIVEPLLGNNRDVAPKNVADRVIVGYFEDTPRFIPTAIECLKNNSGVVHYHDVFSDSIDHDKVLENLQNIADVYDRNADFLKTRLVKSYAPGVSHYVFDIKIG